MLKTIATLFRGRAADAVERVAEAGAMTILSRQVRDCAVSLAQARRAFAAAAAEAGAETRSLAGIGARIADLEQRVRAAIAAGLDDVAYEGAGAIARLEGERDSSRRCAAAFEREVAVLRSTVAEFESRLLELERGRRLAAVERRLLDAGTGAGALVRAGLGDAEATLGSIRGRHARERDAGAAALAMESSSATAAVERLAAAGCGPKLRIDADDVLRRLRAALPAPQDGTGENPL